jgi:hypothetical protein
MTAMQRWGAGGRISSPRLLAHWIALAAVVQVGIDARLSRWSAPRTNDLDSHNGTTTA